MLSKCLNPRCTARFRYLGEGRLFRVDFSEASRKKKALFGGPLKLDRERPIEHFWLCENCAPKMTLQLTEQGDVRLISLDTAEEIAEYHHLVEQAS
jgi:hypothetical protein